MAKFPDEFLRINLHTNIDKRSFFSDGVIFMFSHSLIEMSKCNLVDILFDFLQYPHASAKQGQSLVNSFSIFQL